MTIQVRDRKTNNIMAVEKTNDFAKMFVCIIDDFRRNYTNAVVEVFYGEPNNNPVSTFPTFH